MGNAISAVTGPSYARTCAFNKEVFNKILNHIRDAHEVTQYYANILLKDTLPISSSGLPDGFKNYTPENEKYFNTKRDQVLPDLGTSYYDFYTRIKQNLVIEYDRANQNDVDRRRIIVDVFDKCYIVQKYLIEDLWETCNDIGGDEPFELYPYAPAPVEGSSEANFGHPNSEGQEPEQTTE